MRLIALHANAYLILSKNVDNHENAPRNASAHKRSEHVFVYTLELRIHTCFIHTYEQDTHARLLPSSVQHITTHERGMLMAISLLTHDITCVCVHVCAHIHVRIYV